MIPESALGENPSPCAPLDPPGRNPVSPRRPVSPALCPASPPLLPLPGPFRKTPIHGPSSTQLHVNPLLLNLPARPRHPTPARSPLPSPHPRPHISHPSPRPRFAVIREPCQHPTGQRPPSASEPAPRARSPWSAHLGGLRAAPPSPLGRRRAHPAHRAPGRCVPDGEPAPSRHRAEIVPRWPCACQAPLGSAPRPSNCRSR